MAEEKKKKNWLKVLGKSWMFLGRARSCCKLNKVLVTVLKEIVILTNQREIRCAHGRRDIANLLQHAHYVLAAHRADYVLIEQRKLDALRMVENFCKVLHGQCEDLKSYRSCPRNLTEAISSVIYFASRFEESSEIRQLSAMLEKKFGWEFTSTAVDLREHHAVNENMIERLSDGELSMNKRIQLLRDVSTENKIQVDIEKLAKALYEIKTSKVSYQEWEEEGPEAVPCTAQVHGLEAKKETKSTAGDDGRAPSPSSVSNLRTKNSCSVSFTEDSNDEDDEDDDDDDDEEGNRMFSGSSDGGGRSQEKEEWYVKGNNRLLASMRRKQSFHNLRADPCEADEGVED